jgi:hypothetical protein
MSDHVRQTIADLQFKLKEQEAAVVDTKRLINNLCGLLNEPSLYLDLSVTEGPSLSIQSDQFYGQPLAASIREILEMRRTLKQGPATVNEIFTALETRGYKFETKNEENSKRSLRISLSKNTAAFHKLPNGKYGLLEWYPSAKPAKPRDVNADDAKSDNTDEEQS